MDYDGWLLSIYDKYKEKYNEKYPNERLKFKEISSKNKIKMVYFFAVLFVGLFVLGYAVYYKNVQATFISILLIVLGPLLVMYTNETKLNKYRNHIDVLYNVLADEKLNRKTQIEDLAKDTGGISYRIKITDADKVLKLITSLLGAASITYLFNKVTSDILILIISLVIMIVSIIWVIYSILLMVPNSRLERKKRFNELLKVLLIYMNNDEFNKPVDNSKNVLNEKDQKI